MGDPLPTAHDHRPGDVVHVVLLRFLPTTSAEQRAEVQRRFHALADSRRNGRPLIRRIRSGPQISPEPGRGRYGAGFVVEFDSEGDRNFYLGRPFVGDAPYDEPHDAFKAFVGPLLEPDGGVLTFDLASGSPLA